MTFKIGDTVQLKSGGPLMTVESLENDGAYWCVWFTPNGNEKKGDRFKGEMLVEA